jgi:hypothetical protein
MLLVGVHSTNRHLGQIAYPCPSCRRQTWHAIARTRRWITVLFIPVLPFARACGVRCNLCGFLQHVPTARAETWMRAATARPMPPPPLPAYQLPPPGAVSRR